MDKKIRDIKELIEQKREVLKQIRPDGRSVLMEELADLEIELKLLEITQSNNKI